MAEVDKVEAPLVGTPGVAGPKRRRFNPWPLVVLAFPILFYGAGILIIFSQHAGSPKLGSWAIDLRNSGFAGIFLILETAVILVVCFAIPKGGD